MSDTPRTDALLAQFKIDTEGRDHEPPFAELARGLERENTRLRAALNEYAVNVISIAGIVGCDLCGAEEGPHGLKHKPSCVLHNTEPSTGALLPVGQE